MKTDSTEHDLSDMKIKKLSETRDTLVNVPFFNHILKESEITVGMAIDALIKAGAKISITLEA